MIVEIPLLSVKSQLLSVQLGGQSCQIKIAHRTFGMYVDLYVNQSLIIGGVLALNDNRIVRSKYLGFLGDLYFHDRHGTSNPSYDGLGSRFVLLYDDML